jgi:hypothetical protein
MSTEFQVLLAIFSDFCQNPPKMCFSNINIDLEGQMGVWITQGMVERVVQACEPAQCRKLHRYWGNSMSTEMDGVIKSQPIPLKRTSDIRTPSSIINTIQGFSRMAWIKGNCDPVYFQQQKVK